MLKLTEMLPFALVVSIAALAFASGRGAVTWQAPAMSVQLPDGSVVVTLVADGGFFDAGEFPDGGPPLNAPYDLDGGWTPGAAILPIGNPVPTELSYKVTCSCSPGPAPLSDYVTLGLQGSSDPTNPQVFLAYPGATFTANGTSGDAGVGGILQTQGAVAPWTEPLFTSNSWDGGAVNTAPTCACTYEAW